MMRIDLISVRLGMGVDFAEGRDPANMEQGGKRTKVRSNSLEA